MLAPSPSRSDRPRAPGWFWRVLALLLLSAWGSACSSLPANVERTPSRAFDAPDQTNLGRLVQSRRAQARARSESGFTLLDSVDAAFTSRLALIEGAQRSLDLQYYAIHADASTEVLLDRMRTAARRGVRVRILLDDFNTVGEDAQVLRLAFEPNVEIRLFNPLPGPRGSLFGRILGSLHDVESMQKRMHNKLFIADNAWGITGGRNLGDEYFGGDQKSNFVDLDVLAAGAIVRQMSASFDRYWNDELAYPVQALLKPPDLERLQKEPAAKSSDPAREPAGNVQPVSMSPSGTVLPNVTATAVVSARRPPMDLQRAPITWAPAVLLVDKPGKVGPGDDEVDRRDTAVDGLLHLIQQAQREVLIISPYFVPGADMMKLMAELRRRGVAVRVLTNSLASNDAPAAHAGYRRYRPDLLAMGVELYEMRADPASAGLEGGSGSSGSSSNAGISLGSAAGGSKSGRSRASLHSKAVIIDRHLAVIGSMNLDLRSQLKNSEVGLVIRSQSLAQACASLIESSFARGAYRLEQGPEGLRWRAPPGAPFQDATSEPEAPLKLRLLVNLLAPFAPDEML
ncbi:phospholipase D family protein [Ramlibacter henchirensis]|uniref:Phospholipase D family protein n=1 Tax=Ramlibacter henchirensis TaxID=204072 RepID=A0A4Z0C9L4_9BURK|nr:phospholipase D family protein [Ramlibacter henchirensis]TFZ07098.1 phospholipase D family protein [Ramlibacter henchirensis]